jgi:hypothetical protein
MTALAPHASSRIVAVTRLHFVNRFGVFVLPNLIMLLVLSINVLIWWALYVAAATDKARIGISESLQYSGAGFYIFVYMMVFAVQSIAITFPFAQGYGVTRRNYWAGTALSYVLLSVGYAAALTLLGWIEELTHGWGFGGHMFTAVYYGDGPWYARFVVFFALMLVAFFTGSMFASVYIRWRATGLIGAFLILGVLAAAGTALAIATHAGSWLFDVAFTTSVTADATTHAFRVVWLIVFAAISAGIGFLVLRRTTPRN